MNFRKYEHNNPIVVIPEAIRIDVERILSNLNVSLSESTRKLRAKILDGLAEKGWSSQVRVSSDAKITITSIFKNTGLCLQTGNMGRFYADLLKLQTLYSTKKIAGCIYIVPTKYESKRIGSNRVHFDRFVDELKVFSQILTIPIIVYGFERRA